MYEIQKQNDIYHIAEIKTGKSVAEYKRLVDATKRWVQIEKESKWKN